MDISPEGTVYSQRYHVYDYPHVAIIDPRTRRLLWKKEGWTQQNPLTAGQFAEMAMDFCSRHSFDKPPQAPRSSGASRPSKRPVQEMSEDEQLQAAMRASIQDATGEASKDDDDDEYEMEDDDDDDEVQVLDGNKTSEEGQGDAVEESKPEAKPAEPSMLDELLSMSIGEEPSKGARVQIKMPDGSKKVRRFNSSKEVKTIYAFVAVSGMCRRCDGGDDELYSHMHPI